MLSRMYTHLHVNTRHYSQILIKRIFSKEFRKIFKYQSVEITNKMQLCNRIYYSTVHWNLNMFRAAYRSSSGAVTVFAASGQVWVPTQTWLRPVTTSICKPEAANTVRAPDDEWYAARNMLSLQWTVE